tara:strand:+ start:2123 stop:2299 length:177 start_codon:yes stop_codon:yes gene_type:complete
VIFILILGAKMIFVKKVQFFLIFLKYHKIRQNNSLAKLYSFLIFALANLAPYNYIDFD